MIDILHNINLVANILILVFLLCIGVSVVRARNLLVASVLLGIFSILMATEYLVLAAPDVAITEASVGAGISTVLLLLGIFLVGEKEKRVKGRKLLPFIMVVSIAAMLVYASGGLPVFGSGSSPAQSGVASYYTKNSVIETGVPNVVTAVLASYRGYDTFGETLVIFTAGIAVLMLLGKFGKNKNKT